MKPYGRVSNIKSHIKSKGHTWKVDYHIHENNKKVGNWWEDMDTEVDRGSLNQIVRLEIASEILNSKEEMDYIQDPCDCDYCIGYDMEDFKKHVKGKL